MSETHHLIFDNGTSLSVSGISDPDEHFEFEEIIGTKIVGKQRNGTLVNGGQIVLGIVGNAIEFDDVNFECVDYGPIHEPCFDDMDQCIDGFTLTFWTDTVYTVHQITAVGIGCGKTESRQGIRFDLGSGMSLISVKWSDGYQVGIFPLNPPTGWIHHGVIFKRGQEMKYLLNGTLVSPLAFTEDAASSTIGGSVRFGHHSEDINPETFSGKIDDVRLWKIAKCPEFVKYIYDMYKK